MTRLLLLVLLLLPLTSFAATEVPPQVRDFLHNNPAGHKISVGDLLKRMAGPEKLTFIDVRTPQEFAVMHITGAINIPYDRLAEHLDQIPHDGLVIVYCHSGRRAEGATAVLQILGYTNAVNLSGGIKALAPAITSKSAPPVDAFQLATPPGSHSPDDTESDDEEEDFGC